MAGRITCLAGARRRCHGGAARLRRKRSRAVTAGGDPGGSVDYCGFAPEQAAAQCGSNKSACIPGESRAADVPPPFRRPHAARRRMAGRDRTGPGPGGPGDAARHRRHRRAAGAEVAEVPGPPGDHGALLRAGGLRARLAQGRAADPPGRPGAGGAARRRQPRTGPEGLRRGVDRRPAPVRGRAKPARTGRTRRGDLAVAVPLPFGRARRPGEPAPAPVQDRPRVEAQRPGESRARRPGRGQPAPDRRRRGPADPDVRQAARGPSALPATGGGHVAAAGSRGAKAGAGHVLRRHRRAGAPAGGAGRSLADRQGAAPLRRRTGAGGQTLPGAPRPGRRRRHRQGHFLRAEHADVLAPAPDRAGPGAHALAAGLRGRPGDRREHPGIHPARLRPAARRRAHALQHEGHRRQGGGGHPHAGVRRGHAVHRVQPVLERAALDPRKAWSSCRPATAGRSPPR